MGEKHGSYHPFSGCGMDMGPAAGSNFIDPRRERDVVLVDRKYEYPPINLLGGRRERHDAGDKKYRPLGERDLRRQQHWQEIEEEMERMMKYALMGAPEMPWSRIDRQALANYKREVEETEGFDITFFPFMNMANCIHPAVGPGRGPRADLKKINRHPWISYARFAVHHHNSSSNKNLKLKLKLLRVVNMNSYSAGLYTTYYITFEAIHHAADSDSDSDFIPKIYQARVYGPPGDLQLLLFREKPVSSSSSSSSSSRAN